MHIETRTRSLVKAVSWRIIASITTAAIAYYFGVPMKAVGLIFFADLIIKFILYFFHERAWGFIKFGIKSKQQE